MSFFPSSKDNRKSSYQPNLVSLMSLCANNYFLLLKLQADQTELDEQRHFFINDNLAYHVRVNEVTRYTSLITFEQTVTEQKIPTQRMLTNKKLAHAIHPTMIIRLYHDARMAEVISSQGIVQVKPRYDYPNAQMHQQDEKQQINQFLNEWLHLCLQMGQVNVPMPTVK
ncbi:MAG: DUF1249 domain-containing protein [Colwellia sp.]|nr:DUF1249 domain-containing protein [Colwellia sp.]MCW8863371.1 DUF1249 domain-containing protein [Colwellia sp.]MCW9080026.1 DUF1249 domain-containing protein [Colwellia sp.]